MFRNSNLVVTGGHFTNIDNTGINDAVSTVLWPHVASGAIFDSAERYPPGKCHPGTREKMIQKIVDWIDDPDPAHRILWVYGLAGSGKSALAHTICEFMRQTDTYKCVGSFFFARGLTDRGKGLKLFATLSYQLAIQFPSMRAEINEALCRDPSLPTKSMEIQLFSLIIQPLLRCRSFPSHSPTLIIDGLDECADDQGMDTQRTIITLISQSIVKYNIPLRFIIACRPEYWIRDTFETSPLLSITLSLSLRDDKDVDKDIRAYLVDGFEKIRVENLRIMGSVVPPWPSPNIVDRFVYEASGQYIYASTLLKFVGQSSRFSDPQEQLRILISPGPERALAFSELDRLYKRIISVYPRWTTMKLVLGGILAGVNSTVIEIILGVESTELTLVLDALCPLIDIKRPRPLSQHESLLEPIFGSLLTGQEDISLCHLSFREFLQDETRSGAFHINVCDIVNGLSQAFCGIIHRSLEQNYTTEPHILLNIGLAAYKHMMSKMVWSIMEKLEIDTLLEVITGLTRSIRRFYPAAETSHIGCYMQDLVWIEDLLFVSRASFWGKPTNNQQFEQEKVYSLMDASLELKDVAFSSRKRCIDLMSSSSKFSVTPTLAYLNDLYTLKDITVDEMFTIVPGQTVPDILSVFQQHRHIINMHYSHSDHIRHLVTVNLDDNSFEYDNNDADEGWRTRSEWKHHRISIMAQHLNTASKNAFQEENLYWYLGNFFKSRNLSDVHSRNYFENPCSVSILASITDISAWIDLLNFPNRWLKVEIFINPVLCWFNRQLTNPEALRLLEEYDKTLAPRMRTTMKEIFEQHFLPHFGGAYYSELYVSTSMLENDDRSIKIKVLPLPQGYHEEEIQEEYILPEELDCDLWRPLHDEVFMKTGSMSEQPPIPPTINPLHWHPFLASRLLNALAKDLYQRIHTSFGVPKLEISKESFTYIMECPPYAHTTQQNLDSLRAIAYLFPQANFPWDPPIDFWFISVEFLKKYDRTILSEEELNLFEWWMYSMRRYMKRYRPAT